MNPHAARRRCLALAASSLFLAANLAAASISTSTSASSPAAALAPPSLVEGPTRKRKKRRRRKGAVADGLGAVDDEELQRRVELRPAEIPVAELSDAETASSCNKPAALTTDAGSAGSHAEKRRRRKRRRKLVEELVGDVMHRTGEDVLLPIDEKSSNEHALASDCAHDMQADEVPNEESMSSETQAMEEHTESPSITVSKNETSESMSLRDDSDADGPHTTCDYTKHNEEETIQVHDASPDGGQSPDVIASMHSTRQYENIQVSRGEGMERSVTVQISRQSQQQTVHIANNNLPKQSSTKKKPTLSKPKKATATAVTARGSGKGGECLRRIKREWKDAVKMGIAYDWINARTVRDVSNANNDYVRIGPFGKNLLRWHFSVSGPSNSVYEDGIYHGRVLLPKDYPGSPPRVQMLTPSGRFICGADICLSASSYHPETWTPRWTVLSLVDALRLHMLTTANEIGGVMASDDRRREYAKESRLWHSPGIADHALMVGEGIYPLSSVFESESGDHAEINTTIDEPAVAAPVSEKTEASVSDEVTSKPEGTENERNVANPPPIHAVKSAKSVKPVKLHHEQKANAKKGGKSAKLTKARSENRRKNVAATATKRSTGGGLSKRIVIEMLKLPLRILSILLRVLGGLESRLREILDHL